MHPDQLQNATHSETLILWVTHPTHKKEQETGENRNQRVLKP